MGPTQLPPFKGVFDLRNVLPHCTEPMNKRTYRYSSVNKDIIERLVQQMLDQGIIQPTYSPFVDLVVLVGKIWILKDVCGLWGLKQIHYK